MIKISKIFRIGGKSLERRLSLETIGVSISLSGLQIGPFLKPFRRGERLMESFQFRSSPEAFADFSQAGNVGVGFAVLVGLSVLVEWLERSAPLPRFVSLLLSHVDPSS